MKLLDTTPTEAAVGIVLILAGLWAIAAGSRRLGLGGA